MIEFIILFYNSISKFAKKQQKLWNDLIFLYQSGVNVCQILLISYHQLNISIQRNVTMSESFKQHGKYIFNSERSLKKERESG